MIFLPCSALKHALHKIPFFKLQLSQTLFMVVFQKDQGQQEVNIVIATAGLNVSWDLKGKYKCISSFLFLSM